MSQPTSVQDMWKLEVDAVFQFWLSLLKKTEWVKLIKFWWPGAFCISNLVTKLLSQPWACFYPIQGCTQSHGDFLYDLWQWLDHRLEVSDCLWVLLAISLCLAYSEIQSNINMCSCNCNQIPISVSIISKVSISLSIISKSSLVVFDIVICRN